MDANAKQEAFDSAVDPPPFEMKTHHTKALLTLLHCYHSNRQTLTYSELSLRIGAGEKTKGWQCVAWKDLKTNEYIVPSLSDKKCFELSDKGVALASTLATEEELAEFKPPDSTEALHKKIKAKLERDPKAKRYGPRILDRMSAPDYIPVNRHELAAKFNVLADGHGFFYGLQALQKMGYVVHCSKSEIKQLQVRPKATAQLKDDGAAGRKSGGEKRALDEESGADTKEPAKKKTKVYKSKKKGEGGKPLKLSDTAVVKAPNAAVATPISL